jgi:hypothetical protein
MDPAAHTSPVPPTASVPEATLAQGRRWDLIAAIAGLLFVVLVLGSFFTPGTPASDTPIEDIAAQLQVDLPGHQLSLFLGFLGDVAFLVFVAGVWSRLRRWEGPAGMFSGLFVLAAVAATAVLMVSEGLYLALAQYGAAADPDLGALQSLTILNEWVGAAVVPAFAATFIGAATAILTTRALPQWLGWLAALIALLLLVSLGGVFQTDPRGGVIEIAGFGGFLLFLVWVLATSIVLLLRRGAEPVAGARQVSPA